MSGSESASRDAVRRYLSHYIAHNAETFAHSDTSAINIIRVINSNCIIERTL